MGKRVLILRAGTGAGNNLIRSLRTGDPSLFIAGCHDDRFVLKKSTVDRNYLIPPASHPHFARALRRVIRAEKIDLLIPNSDADVRVVSRLRKKIPCRLFLPRQATIELCQDKYELNVFLRSRGLPVPATYPVTDPRRIAEIFRRFPPRSRVWCRVRRGTASIGAIPVRTPQQARSWIRCWEELRRIPAASFILSEYLPGRDLACQSLWKDGELVLAKTYERLSYFVGGGVPSGVSSVAALAKTVVEPRLVEVCASAIRALDGKASGAFSVDLKENSAGIPCITEINVGRLSSGMSIFDPAGKHNMAITYVRVALGERVEISEAYDVAEDYYMLRDLDALPGVFHAEELFEGLEEVWR